jgi:mono/diheme cytochrome c family protein
MAFLLTLLLIAVIGVICAALWIQRGFSAIAEPSRFETVVARTMRNLAIPGRARNEKTPFEATSENLLEGREHFLARCASCHGHDGSGQTQVGRDLYPRAPDLRSAQTQNLTDGEIHYIIENGVELTGMPAWGNPHQVLDDDSWILVLFIRSLRPLTRGEQTQQADAAAAAHYAGSQACEKCHAQIYQRWKKKPLFPILLQIQ